MVVGPFDNLDSLMPGITVILQRAYNYEPGDRVIYRESNDVPDDGPRFHSCPPLIQALRQTLRRAGVNDVSPYLPPKKKGR